MDISLAVKNIIIVGEFEPAFFDKYFFIKHNIVKEDDIQNSSIFMAEACMLNTEDFNLTIVSNQLVITDLKVKSEIQNIIEITEKIISVSQFNYSAMGINFHWYLFSGEKTTEISKKYFYNENDILTNKFFNEDNVSYGTYLSKDFGLSRMKLDIKPATLSKINNDEVERVIAFTFNFHVDLRNENKIIDVLPLGQKYCDETIKVIKSYEFN